jgi:hypothetical protein
MAKLGDQTDSCAPKCLPRVTKAVMYRVSHNTWDYKNALGRPLNDNVKSWEVSHFEAKDHTLQTPGVRF